MRVMFCESFKLGSTSARERPYIIRISYRRWIASIRVTPNIFSSYVTSVIMLIFSMLSSFCVSCYSSYVCPWTFLWSSWSWMIPWYKFSYELCESICYPNSYMRFWNCCMLWWASNYCMKCEPNVSTSYSSRLKLYCSSHASYEL